MTRPLATRLPTNESDVTLYPAPVVHEIPWRDGSVDLGTYDLGILQRLAQGRFVPATPVAAALISRLKVAGIEPADLLDAILATGVEVPVFDEMDEAGFPMNPDYQAIVEAILVEHLDRWREIDDPDGAHSLRKKAQR